MSRRNDELLDDLQPASSKEERNADVREYLIELATNQGRADRRTVNNRVATSVGRELLLVEHLDEALKRVFRRGWTQARPYRGKRSKNVERVVSIVISDTHFQSTIDPRENPQEYGPVEESRRLGKVAAQVADYKRHYRKDTRLSVKILGDIIQNQLHDAREGAPLAAQFAATLQYLTSLVLFWAHEYQTVDVHCASGNHGRNKWRHYDKAVQQKWDSIETMIYVSMKTALAQAGASNVRVHIPLTPYTIEEIAGQKAFWTHGDSVLKPGYPGKDIKVADLHRQILRWNGARRINGPFKLFGVGHVHFGSITNMPGGVVMLTNGCLVPPDSFAISIGSPDVTCGQYMFESTPGHILGDQRFIDVDDADEEPAYNKIIKPFAGF